MRVLILRPEPGASATAAKARALGLEPLSTPLFEVSAVAWEAPDPAQFDALMLTSANAVRYAGAALASYATLRCYVVGSATAQAAQEYGLAPAHVGDLGVAALLNQVASDGHTQVLHLTGIDYIDAQHPKFSITRRSVYAARIIDPPPALPLVNIILIHSPRAAKRLAEITVAEQRASYTIVAISVEAAAHTGAGWRAVHHAGSSDDDALLALAREQCKTAPNGIEL